MTGRPLRRAILLCGVLLTGALVPGVSTGEDLESLLADPDAARATAAEPGPPAGEAGSTGAEPGPAAAKSEPAAAFPPTDVGEPPTSDSPTGEAVPAAARSPRAIEEIVVTAQRRAERLQDVPVSVSAFTEEMIDQREITTVADIEHSTPGFVYAHVGGTSQPTIRGVGSDIFTAAGEPGVALYVDDVYIGRTFLPHAALVGMERIEVLRGPQGTLYGRNTSGGAVKFVTKRPTDELEASAGIQYGSFDQILGQGSLSGPIVSDLLRGRVSFFAEDHDGWVRDRTNGGYLESKRVRSGRLALDADPLGRLRVGLTADLTRQDDEGPVAFPLSEGFAEQAGGRASEDPRATFTDFPADGEVSSEGIALNTSTDLDFGTTTVIASYRQSEKTLLWDLDGTDFPLYQFDPLFQDGEQVSVEAQLASSWELPFELGPVEALTGFFFYDEEAGEVFDIRTLAVEGVGDFLFLSEAEVTSYAGFGHADWKLREWLTLRAGGRYTVDRKTTLLTIENPIPGESCENLRPSESFDAFTGLIGLDVPVDEARLLYASLSQGFKAGGFNTGGCRNLEYAPEFVDAFEAGFKSEWLEDLLRVNVAGFFYTFDDIQVQQIDGFSAKIVNAAEAEIKGVELELVARPFVGGALLEGLSIDGHVAWLDARYEEFTDDDALTPAEGPIDLSGNRLPKSPEWTGSLGLEHGLTMGSLASFGARLEWAYRGRQFFTQFNDARFAQPAYDLWNGFVRLDLASGRGGIRGFVKNIADEAYLNGAFTSIAVGGGLGYYAPPRTWGIEVHASF